MMNKGIDGTEIGSSTGNSPYDMASIMHYGSWTGLNPAYGESKIGSMLQIASEVTVVYSFTPAGGTLASAEIYRGGAEDDALKSISVGDIARVAQIYPVSDAMTAQALAQKRWPPRSVTVGGVLKVDVYQAPADPRGKGGAQRPDPAFAVAVDEPAAAGEVEPGPARREVGDWGGDWD